MVTRAEFNAKLDEIVVTIAAELQQVTAALESKVPAEIDLTEEYAKLQAVQESIKAIVPDAPTVE